MLPSHRGRDTQPRSRVICRLQVDLSDHLAGPRRETNEHNQREDSCRRRGKGKEEKSKQAMSCCWCCGGRVGKSIDDCLGLVLLLLLRRRRLGRWVDLLGQGRRRGSNTQQGARELLLTYLVHTLPERNPPLQRATPSTSMEPESNTSEEPETKGERERQRWAHRQSAGNDQRATPRVPSCGSDALPIRLGAWQMQIQMRAVLSISRCLCQSTTELWQPASKQTHALSLSLPLPVRTATQSPVSLHGSNDVHTEHTHTARPGLRLPGQNGASQVDEWLSLSTVVWRRTA